ncbi:MAG: hypothetical protein CVU69_06300 [Deltaproteobacteria bacterium HGW-Deltaproteobacteria-4]|nr:MAG: hypothetical protein CVU69_06300 [Deltaproteobacteria bacterium HGW-Deltaproteobacteria-4]
MIVKIKNKMTLAVSALVFSLMFVTAWSSLLYFEREIKASVTRQQYALVSSTAHAIERSLLESQSMTQSLAKLITPEMLASPEKAQEFLDKRFYVQKHFSNSLFLFAPSGRLIAAYPSRVNFIGADFSFRDYLKKTLKTGLPQISDPFLSRQKPSVPILMFTAPVRDAAGQIQAVLGGAVDLSSQDTFNSLGQKMEGQGYFHLYSKNNRTFIAHHDQSQILEQVAVGTNPLFDQAVAGFEGTVEGTTTCGLEALISTVQLKTVDWVLEAGYPLEVAYAPLAKAKRYFIIGGGAAVLATLFLVRFLMSFMLAPLLRFTRQVREMTEPEAPRLPVQIASRDEVGLLAEAFNRMLVEINHEKAALREQLSFSRSLMNTIPIPVCYKDAQGSYLGCNSAFESFMAIKQEELVGKCLHEIMPREVADTFMASEQKVLSEEGIHLSEGSFFAADGFRHHVLFYKTALTGPDGLPTGSIGAMLDITEQKKSQALLQEIAGTVSSAVGTLFFHSMVHFLAETLRADFVFISRIVPERPEMAETLAVFDHGAPGGNFCYPLQWTACDYEVDSGSVFPFRWMRDIYPDNPCFSEMNIENCIGSTITDTSDNVIGFLFILSAKPLKNVVLAESLLKIFVSRAGAELQRVSAEAELLKSYDFCLSLFEEFPALIWRSGLDARCNYFNGTWLRFAGRSLEEELGDGWIERVHPDDREGLKSMYFSAFAERREFQTEYRLRRLDGEYRWFMSIGRPFNGLDDRFAGYIGACFDRTDEKLTEDGLWTMSGAIEQNPSAILITDAKGIVRYANRKYCDLTSFDLDHVIGYDLTAVTSVMPELGELLVAAVTSGRENQGEFLGRKGADDEYCAVARTSPIINSKGEISHFCLTMEDVTERKRLENQLRHSQKMEAVGTLAGGVAHDFNNILTAIMGYGELIKLKAAADSPIRPPLQKLLAAADRAATLTRNLLTYSRKQPLTTLSVDVNVIVNNVASLLARLLREDIEFVLFPAEYPLTIEADSSQIEQVLMNLATNARDAMPEGGILQIRTSRANLDTVFIKAHGYGEEGPYARITVSDNGQGMDDTVKTKIFEPFFTTKEVDKGTGLGLSIVYGIIKQHKGFINVYSEPGKGTTFTICLPLSNQRVEECAAEMAAPFVCTGDETLLLVEDDEAIRGMLCEVLMQNGYTVIEASDGVDGVQKFRDYPERIAMVILDVVMPKKNGRAAYDEILKIRPGTKALFMSGYTADMLGAENMLEEGLNFISKPILIDNLLRKIREVLAA